MLELQRMAADLNATAQASGCGLSPLMLLRYVQLRAVTRLDETDSS